MGAYLITGGAGFIGSHLCEALLSAGHRLRVIDNLSSGRREYVPPEAELRIGDINDRALLTEAMEGCDGCFHLAATASVERSRLDWLGTHRSNLTGAIQVFDVARLRSRPLPVVYASSAAVYGDSPDLPLKETALPSPLSAYAADKLGCESHARAGWHMHGLSSVGLRFFNVYGPRQDASSPYSGVISRFADCLAKEQTLTIYGDGQQSRDFIYVGDVVRYLWAAMASLTEGCAVYNVCSGHAVSILDLAMTLEQVTARRAVRQFMAARSGDIRHSLGDPSAALARFGIISEVSLSEGLEKTVAFAEG